MPQNDYLDPIETKAIALPITARETGGQLAPISPEIKQLGQECLDLMPEPTQLQLQKIANLIRQGDVTKLTTLHQRLVEYHQTNTQITNTTDNSLYYAPQTTDLDYHNHQITHEGDLTYAPTLVYAPQFYEVTYAPTYEHYEVDNSVYEVDNSYYHYAPDNSYYHEEGGGDGGGVNVNIDASSKANHSSSGSGSGSDPWSWMLWMLTLLLVIIFAYGISGGMYRVNSFNFDSQQNR